ncbi:MAG: hypothetical protein Q9190_007936 [Brigantiaea leucoxantha]
MMREVPVAVEVAGNVSYLLLTLRGALFKGQGGGGMVCGRRVDHKSTNHKATTGRLRQRSALKMERPDQTAISMMERFFPYILKVIGKLDEVSTDGTSRSQLVYQTVVLTQDILEHICALAAMRGKQTYNQSRNKRIVRSSRSKCSEHVSQDNSLAADNEVMTWCRLLISLIACLDSKRLADKHVQEGFFYFLLTKIGELLRYFAFGLEADKSLAEGLGPVFDQRAFRPHGTSEKTELSKATKEAQAPYLIWVLERAMAIMTRSTGDAAIIASQGGVRQGILSEKAKTQFQHTLLKGVFGNQVEEYTDSLQQPCDPGIDLAMLPKRSQPEEADHFKSEVWRLVGWDILTSFLVRS